MTKRLACFFSSCQSQDVADRTDRPKVLYTIAWAMNLSWPVLYETARTKTADSHTLKEKFRNPDPLAAGVSR